MKKLNEKLKDVPEDKFFWTNDGGVIKNLRELAPTLRKMNLETFSHHVNEERNDFSNWVRNVIGDQELADELSGIKNKTNAASIVSNRIKEIRSG